jgi:hypothetical protein
MRRAFGYFRGIILAGFGFLCLNYTKAFGGRNHHAWAEAHDLPSPSAWMFYLGVACLLLGAATLGYSAGRHRGSRMGR